MTKKFQGRGILRWIFIALVGSALACNLPGQDIVSEAERVPGPQVAFQDPTAGMQIAVGEMLPIFVNASDPTGVKQFDLWVDDVLVLSQLAPEGEPNGISPMVLSDTFIGTEPGVFALMARAYNSVGVMGESMVVHVTVTEERSSTKGAGIILHSVRAGQTLEEIAALTGNSVSAIQQANPGVADPLRAGQLVVLPAAPAGQVDIPPAQAAVAAGQLPGIVPIQAAAVSELPVLPGDANQLPQAVVNLFPVFDPPANNLNPSISMPAVLSTSVADCKVTLNWTNSASDQIGYTIFRRRSPDQPAAQIVANLAAGTATYVDKVPAPGSYEYSVEATGAVEIVLPAEFNIQQGALAAVRSAVVKVQVPPSAACIESSDSMKYLHVQIMEVTGKQGSGGYAALWYSINNSVGRRVPSSQGHYHPFGNWNTADEIIPVPTALLLNPDQKVVVKFWGLSNSTDNRPPQDLGEAYDIHNPGDISVNDSRYYIAENDNFKVEYKIWIEDRQWTGQGTDPTLTGPTNLRVLRTSSSGRVITWDFAGELRDLEGFILYKRYSCPGMETQIRAPQLLPSASAEAEIVFSSEPMGCVYQYQVSAFSRAGESPASNTIHGETEAAYALAGVTFKEIDFGSLPDRAVPVILNMYVNHHRRTSSIVNVSEGGYNLSSWVLNGRSPHNSLGLVLGQKEFLTIGFSASSIHRDSDGYVSSGVLCRGVTILPPVDSWSKPELKLKIRSADGSCTLSVELNSQRSEATSSGGIVKPQADISVTEVRQIGDMVFARIENKGPDELPANRIGYTVSWFKIVAGGFTQVTGHRYNHDLWVQSSLPQWIHLDDALDGFLADTCKLGSGGSLSDCGYMLYIPTWPYYEGENPESGSFIDPVPGGGYYQHFDRINLMD